MKRTAMAVAILSVAMWAEAQNYGTAGGQQTPAPAAATGQSTAAGSPAAPAAKRPPQAKTQPELDAYNAGVALKEAPALEKAADDFGIKFPDSELRILLYATAMRTYQNANNAEKTEAMGRKVLALDGDNPEGLVIVAEVIAERTRDTDLDKEQRFDEAMKLAQKALSTVETDVNLPGTPQEKVDAYKALLRSKAYSVTGMIDFKKENYVSAQDNLQKSIDAYPAQPDPVDVLRLALSLDKQSKYPDALKVANRAVELTQEGSQIGTLSRRERDRLQQLTGGTAPAPGAPAVQPPKN